MTTSWPEVPLASALQDAKPGFASGENPLDGVFQFRMNNVRTDGRLDLTKKRRVPRGTKRLRTYLLSPGDVLFNATNSPDLVGKSAFFAGHDEPAVFSNHFLRLRADPLRLDGRFLARWLQGQFDRRVFQSRCRQWVNQATFGRDALLAMAMPLPPIEEQRRIAAVLDQVDEVRAKRRVSIDLADSLTESVFVEMFGDAERSWRMAEVGSLAAPHRNAIRTGPFGSQLLHSEFVDDGVRVLGIDNAVRDRFEWGEERFVTKAKFRELQRFQAFPGDVLVTIMGTCGRTAIVPDGVPTAITTKHLCCITLDQERCLPVYLWAVLRFHREFRRQLGATARGAVMPGLNMGLIKSARLALPPISFQRQFRDRVAAATKSLELAVAGEAYLNELFTSLQYRAFRGEL